MKKKRIDNYFGRLLLVLLLLVSFPLTSYAQESRGVETEGSVHFTGVWIDPNEPTPAPPDGDTPDKGSPDLGARPPAGGTKRPGGNLPQTNTVWQGSWLLFGLLLISYVLYRWYNKQTRSTPLH